MPDTLSTTDWVKVDSLVYSVGNGENIRWDSEWDVSIPPLPPLDSNDRFAVKHYILSLVRSAAEAGMDFASFRLIGQETLKAECAISVEGRDGYNVKGLQEWEIRQIAGTEDFRKRNIENLLGA